MSKLTKDGQRVLNMIATTGSHRLTVNQRMSNILRPLLKQGLIVKGEYNAKSGMTIFYITDTGRKVVH